MPTKPKNVHFLRRPATAGRHVPPEITERLQNPERTEEYSRARRIRSSARWQKVRKTILGRRPICELCAKAISYEVHHKKAVATDPDLAFVSSNLAALCRRCHEKIEAAERRGICTEDIFNGQARTAPNPNRQPG
jgi:5-methylcytosine-specific restriction endonuclease McrA